MSLASGLTRPPPPAQILVVDDVTANRLALAAVLEPLGQRVVEARSGDEALKATFEHDFAVILMDVQMPGLDGLATVQALRTRERTRFVPVIFVTAFGEVTPAARGYSLGAFDFITKPFDADVLRGRVGALVALWQRGQQLELQAEALRQNEVARACERAAREAAEAANRMKDEFLAVVSHELRTPLNAILGWAEVLTAGTLPYERVQHGLQTIARNARVQARLVEDLLDVSRIIAGKLKITRSRCDLASIARRAAETVSTMASARGVRLEAVIEAGDHTLSGDPARLQQVVWNLLANAVKFSPSGGFVELTLARDRDALELAVTDNGVGIAAELLPFVFERFRQGEGAGTRAQGGLGLGLAIARVIVELHGGRIHAASEGQGRGATFTVRLPVEAAAEAVPRAVHGETSGRATGQFAPVAVETPRLEGLRVLFVDDEPDARELSTMVLSDAGAEVRAASSAREALALLERERFDVLVSDIGMPGEDGYALMRQVSSRRLGLPAIALSAFTSAADRERALAAGFDTHLAKPLDAPALIGFIDRLARR